MKNRSGRVSRRRSIGSRSEAAGGTDFLELFPRIDSMQPGSSNGWKVEQRPEVNYVAARSSINQLYDVICNFDEMKKALVRSIGFGGMLSFPPIRQINRRASGQFASMDPQPYVLLK